MVDIWKNLTDISLAEFGWQMRVPVAEALRKLNYNGEADILEDIAIIRNNVNSGSLIPLARSGDKVVESILDATMKLRNMLRNSSADNFILNIVNNYLNYSQGNNYKTNIFKILKSYMNGINEGQPEAIGYDSININNPDIRIIAGNEGPMFMEYGAGAEGQIGLKIKWYSTDVRLEPIIVTVENILTGSKISTEFTPEYGEPAPMIFTNDECTNFIDPGAVRITIRYKNDETLVSGAGVITDVCKFGMNPAEKLTPLGDDDFIFTDDLVTYGATKTLFYIGSADRIKMPHKLDNKDILTIGNSTFMDTNVTVAKIQEPVTTIE